MRLIAAALVFVLATSPGTADTLSGSARVTDGDTLRVGGEVVRLFGIDAPERDQTCTRADGRRWPCGAWSRDALVAMVRGAAVTCDALERDQYDRIVARCIAGGRDIGQEMVRSGAAWAYRAYSSDYVDAEKQALFAGLGVWQGYAVAPADHRAAERKAVAASSAPDPGTCVIKGNISTSGRIYHLPGQADYDATRINPARGEFWFCTTAEAEAAGWRAARR